MTHNEITAAVRDALEREAPCRDVYRARLAAGAKFREGSALLANRVVRGSNAEPALAGVESHTRVHASRPEETGSDGRGATPTPRLIPGTDGKRIS